MNAASSRSVSANCSMGAGRCRSVMPTTDALVGVLFAIFSPLINSLTFFHGVLAVVRTTGWLIDVPMKSNASVP